MDDKIKWYKKITNELIADFREYSMHMAFKYCGPAKIKMNKERMNKLIITAQCRGSVSLLDEIMAIIEKEKIVNEELLGSIHIMRMNLWNEAADNSDGVLKRVGLDIAMQVSPDARDLLNIGKLPKN